MNLPLLEARSADWTCHMVQKPRLRTFQSVLHASNCVEEMWGDPYTDQFEVEVGSDVPGSDCNAQPLNEALLQENEFTEAVLGGLLADELEAEMKARIPTLDCSVPQRLDQYWYYWYRRAGEQYRVHARSVSC